MGIAKLKVSEVVLSAPLVAGSGVEAALGKFDQAQVSDRPRNQDQEVADRQRGDRRTEVDATIPGRDR
jgi:hypothetical protein